MRQSSSERARMRRVRSHYRKVTAVAVLIALILGCVGGVVLDRMVLKDRDIPFLSSFDKTAKQPLPEVTPEASPAPAVVGWGGVDAAVSDTPAPASETTPDLGDNTLQFVDQSTEGQQTEGQGTDVQPAANSGAEGQAMDGQETGSQETKAQTADAPETTPEPVEATPEPTPEPTPTPEPAPVEPEVVPYGESYTFQTQVKADGKARMEATDEPYETISLTMSLVNYMLPKDFADKYANQYRLSGTEAGVGFELLLNDYTGDLTIIPEDVIKLTLESEAGDVELGYRLMDAEISGNYGVKIDTNTPKVLYKRYQYGNASENLEYLVVTTYNDGEEGRILFKLKSDIAPEPSPAVVYPILQKGSNGDEVVALQKRLTELGYLEGAIDGAFGSGTERAVKAAQKALGFEQNGIADHQFQVKLFAGAEEETSEASEEAAPNAV